MNRSTLAATSTVVAGIAIFLAVEVFGAEERIVTFNTAVPNVGPLEAINATPFTRSKGQAIITEPLAHLKLPFGRTLLGKRLVIRARFHLDEGDTFEVGVKKTAFWLDYDRLPLQHRILDDLPARDDRTWRWLRSGQRVVFLNPSQQNPWSTVEEFENNPPSRGMIGLYGHAHLPCGEPRPSVRDEPVCTTAPFRINQDPDDFRAIYAFYPEPDRTDPEWTENEQRFDLTRAFQNEDRSLDVMFFVQKRSAGPIRVLLDEIRFRIEPGWPNPNDLVASVRKNLVRLIRRPASAPSETGP